EGEEHALNAAAEVRRRAHPVEDKRVRALPFGRVVEVGPWVEPDERDLAALQFREERAEPVRVLVVDRERLAGHGGLRASCWRTPPSRAGVSVHPRPRGRGSPGNGGSCPPLANTILQPQQPLACSP